MGEEIHLGRVGDGLVPVPPATANIVVPGTSYVWLRPDGMSESPILAQNLSGRTLADGEHVEWIWLSERGPAQAAILGRRGPSVLILRTYFVSSPIFKESIWRVRIPSSPDALATSADLTDLTRPAGSVLTMDHFLSHNGRLYAWNDFLLADYLGTGAQYQQFFNTSGDGQWSLSPLPVTTGGPPSPNFNGSFSAIKHNNKVYGVYKTDPSTIAIWEILPPDGAQLLRVFPQMDLSAPQFSFSMTPDKPGKIYIVLRTTGNRYDLYSWDSSVLINPLEQVYQFPSTATFKMPFHFRSSAGQYVIQWNDLTFSENGSLWSSVITDMGFGLQPQSTGQGSAVTDTTPHGIYYCNYSSPATFGFPGSGPSHGLVHYGPSSIPLFAPGNISRLSHSNQQVAKYTLVSTLTTPLGPLGGDGAIDVVRVGAPLNMVFVSMFTGQQADSPFFGGIWTFVETDGPIMRRWRRWLPNELLAPAGYEGGAQRLSIVDAF